MSINRYFVLVIESLSNLSFEKDQEKKKIIIEELLKSDEIPISIKKALDKLNDDSVDFKVFFDSLDDIAVDKREVFIRCFKRLPIGESFTTKDVLPF